MTALSQIAWVVGAGVAVVTLVLAVVIPLCRAGNSGIDAAVSERERIAKMLKEVF